MTKRCCLRVRGIVKLGTSCLFACSASLALAGEPKVTYVGDGRYTCSGNSAQCAQVEANNRQREMQREMDFQREQDRAQRYVDEGRRRDEERRRNVER